MKTIITRSLPLAGLLLLLSFPDSGAQAQLNRDARLIRDGESRSGKKYLEDWIKRQTGINNASFSVLDWRLYGYGKVLYVKIWDYSNGEAGWASKPVHVVPGKKYEWKSTFLKEGPSAIRVEFKTKSGKIISQTLEILMWHTMDEWVTLTQEFVVPKDVISASVCHSLIGQGEIYSRETSLERK